MKRFQLRSCGSLEEQPNLREYVSLMKRKGSFY